MRFIVYLIAFLMVGTATAQNPTILQGNYITNVFGQSNFVLNPNAQTSTANVTVSSATVTRSTTTPLVATSEFNITTSTSTGYADWATRTFDAGMKGQNCEARFSYRGFSVGSTSVQIRQGSNTVAQLTLTASTDPRIASINFPCGDLSSATTLRVQQATAALTGTNEIGGIYVGLATNMANVSQAEEAGSYIVSAASNCNWSTNSSTVTNFSADADCNTGTVTGSATTTAGKIPGATFNNLKPGKYMFIAHFTAIKAGTVNDSVGYRLGDGSNFSGLVFQYTNLAGTYYNGLTLVFTKEYTTVSSPTIQVQGFSSSPSNSADIYNASTTVGNQFQLIAYRFPTSSELVVTPERQSWFINATHDGASPAMSTANVSTRTEITDASLTFTPREGSQPAATLCSGTNAPPSISSSPTTCAAGSESLGLTFNIPSVGAYKVCAEFGSYVNTNSSGVVDAAFSIEETATNSNTALTTNKSVPRYHNIASSMATSFPVQLCNVFNFTSVGQKAVRLMYQQTTSATVISNSILADSSNNRQLKWIVEPLSNQSNSALYVQGPVLGAQTGAAIGSGYVGELKRTFTATTNFTGGGYRDLQSLVLTPGVWLCRTQTRITRNAATVPASFDYLGCIGGSSGATGCTPSYLDSVMGTGKNSGVLNTFDWLSTGSMPTQIRYDGTNLVFADGTSTASASGTIYHKVYLDTTAGTPQASGVLECNRLN